MRYGILSSNGMKLVRDLKMNLDNREHLIKFLESFSSIYQYREPNDEYLVKEGRQDGAIG